MLIAIVRIRSRYPAGASLRFRHVNVYVLAASRPCDIARKSVCTLVNLLANQPDKVLLNDPVNQFGKVALLLAFKGFNSVAETRLPLSLMAVVTPDDVDHNS